LHFFPGWCAHAQRTKLLSWLDAAIEFHFAILTMAFSSLWQRFERYFLEYRELGFSLDVSRMKFPDDLFEKMRPQIEHAFAAMRELEAGAIANPTENRMVGHYWLRNPALAPTPEIRSENRRGDPAHQGIRRRCSRRKDHREKWKALRARAAHWDRRLRAGGRNSCQPPAARQTIQWTSFSSITRIRRVLIACLTE